jgi:hypothetical protein
MRPVKPPSEVITIHTFKQPENWDEATQGKCEELSVAVDEAGYLVSWWKPSPEELERLNRGHAVTLSIGQMVHPVVALGTSEHPIPDEASPLPRVQGIVPKDSKDLVHLGTVVVEGSFTTNDADLIAVCVNAFHTEEVQPYAGVPVRITSYEENTDGSYTFQVMEVKHG